MGIATNDRNQRIIEILRDSFKENQSVNYIVKQDRKRIQRIEKLLEYSLFQGEQFGKVFISEDRNAACIILFSDQKKTTFKTIQQDIKLVSQVIGLKKVKATLARESLLKQHHPKTPFVHLWYIGVDPVHQKKGIGSKLLEEVIAYCGDKPIYLETSVESNLRWYKKYGFEIIQVLELGYLLYILKKD
ncbi:GNAT family N-acetyltransferase [uncultured Aquimarina sp.]|uniref:GNAT family N-acetyltransferase n=1 Tax=uncultured Aquimarina sp. TaxID=575652 RepID=UPI00261E16E5|nr:GNAT family N-acetyltransferase [uncultured Aquimarina sp.]